ncbi:MAG: hypothetical protein L0Y72_00265 [Gemmataceae bacterium]|nr:hypothetical protein [Gemmataceae bacterium]MCI0737443.1 hypothetical protein [Gemmataceae bacterium]
MDNTAKSPTNEGSFRRFLAYSDAQLTVTDPLEMNLLVAKEIPSLAGLDVQKYRIQADIWTGQLKRGLREAEYQFQQDPWSWKNDLAFFRLGFLCYFVDETLGIRYRDDQKDLKSVFYTDPSDLFLHGVMDSRQGTCANMAALHVTLGWRMRWPVSLACVDSHYICCYHDGKVTHNIEATKTGVGGFQSHPDEYYLRYYRLPNKAVTCGSDLRVLTPREMLGVFVGFRARHYENTNRESLAERDYLLARWLFPNNRLLHFAQFQNSVQYAMSLFEPGERGHPDELATWLGELVQRAPWQDSEFLKKEKEINHAGSNQNAFSYDESGRVCT